MTTDASANNASSTPKTIWQSGGRRKTWISLAVILAVTSLLGGAWFLRGCEAKADGCSCEDKLSFIHENDFRDAFPFPPDLSSEERAERESQLVRQLDAFLLGKWEIVDQFVTTTQASIAPVASMWRSQSSQPCWARYEDHGPWPAWPDDIKVVRSTCGHHDLFAFAQHTGGTDKERYGTWGFFRLRLKGEAS